MNHPRNFVLAVAGLGVLASCGKEDPAATADVTLGLPAMQRPDGWSEARAELGKKLFFDTRLSSNGEMSCSTCHLHEKGWTDGERVSKKVDGSMNTRNSPSLYNVGYQPLFYWDGRAPTMEKNVAAAWKGHMGGDPEAMAATLAGIDAYAKEFEAAFGAAPTGDLIVDAFCAFVRSLQAGGTRYDKYSKGDKSALTADEKAGHDLFMGKALCVACHIPPMFTDFRFHNAGIGMAAETPDVGANKHHPDAAIGSFKTPTLRNVAKTAPYYHDGSTATLEEAVKVMAGGGLANEHLDPIFTTFATRTISDAEVAQLVAFLKALNSNEAFTPPKLP